MYTGMQVLVSVLSVSALSLLMASFVYRSEIASSRDCKKLLKEMATDWPHGGGCESEFAYHDGDYDEERNDTEAYADELCDCHVRAAKDTLGHRIKEIL